MSSQVILVLSQVEVLVKSRSKEKLEVWGLRPKSHMILIEIKIETRYLIKNSQTDQIDFGLKSTSDKKACKKSIRDQKFGASTILKIKYQTPFENVANYWVCKHWFIYITSCISKSHNFFDVKYFVHFFKDGKNTSY